MPYKNQKQQTAYQQAWYQRNKERLREVHKAYRKENKPRLIEWLKGYKSRLSCQTCGESHPACLQFHHRDPSRKRFTISTAVRMCVCREEILKEIDECDVLCANCHAKLHHRN